MGEITKAELGVMNILWKLNKGFLKNIVSEHHEPKPAYTTISTLLNRMVDKGYVGYKKVGREREYFPKINKNSYFRDHFKQIFQQFFNNSSKQLVSYFAQNDELSLEELNDLKDILNNEIAKKKEHGN